VWKHNCFLQATESGFNFKGDKMAKIIYCINCGKKLTGKNNPIRCSSCAKIGHHPTQKTKIKISNTMKKLKINIREKNPQWKGGKYKRGDGYIVILCPNHPFHYPDGYVPEHRLIMEKYLGRYLKSNEPVHHINKIKNDNRIENLIAFISDSAHTRFERGGKINPKEIIFDGRNIKHPLSL